MGELRSISFHQLTPYHPPPPTPPIACRFPRLPTPNQVVEILAPPPQEISSSNMAFSPRVSSPLMANPIRVATPTLASNLVPLMDEVPTVSSPDSTMPPQLDSSPMQASPTVQPSPSSTGIFIGNVPLHAHDSSYSNMDKFAVVFHNSSRKTLSFIPPSTKNEEIIVQPSIEMVREGSCQWANTAMGYFLG
ncbi:UNVERIFIED_CONTAM: hypothetical protein Slati_2666300 [Sesamum latifolium]|uniref:Uncharacterized protein n=1 Tax=Sesamum latifolium TaxID=2727402 RepID=A0AAW2VZ56_9LAMI